MEGEDILKHRSVRDNPYVRSIVVGRWIFFDPEERLPAQVRAGIHTSCRSESSSYCLVVLDNLCECQGMSHLSSANCPLQPGIVEMNIRLSTQPHHVQVISWIFMILVDPLRSGRKAACTGQGWDTHLL